MFRICTIATLIALTISSAAQAAPTLEQRVHDAAVKSCAVLNVPNMSPRSHYGAIEDECVYQLSRSAMSKYQAKNGDQAKIAGK